MMDDDQIESVFHVQTATLCPQLEGGEGGRIVKEDFCVGEYFDGMCKQRPFVFL